MAAVTLWLAPLAVGVSAEAASAAPTTVSSADARSYVPCPAQGEVSSCDSDGDTIPDVVERVVCGAATCATGREDRDEDGIADGVEVMACGTTTCASPTKDSVRDGIPDYARQIVCGSATCWTDNRDVNSHGVPKWASVVICGTTGCATGHEDYDGDGVSDAIVLASCVSARNPLASTGSMIAIGVILALAAALIGTGIVLSRRRGLYSAALEQGAAV